MYKALIIIGFLFITGCASNRMYYSPFDLNRDGTMDAICPGMEYDPKEHSHYGWRSDGSKACRESKAEQAWN